MVIGWHLHRHRLGLPFQVRHDEHKAGTFIWPPPGTSTWPPVGTFSWPFTAQGESSCLDAPSRTRSVQYRAANLVPGPLSGYQPRSLASARSLAETLGATATRCTVGQDKLSLSSLPETPATDARPHIHGLGPQSEAQTTPTGPGRSSVTDPVSCSLGLSCVQQNRRVVIGSCVRKLVVACRCESGPGSCQVAR